MSAIILIEGSSSATGLYDESGKGGFAGRIQHHYERYNIQERTQKPSDLRWVFVYQNSQPDLGAYEVGNNLRTHVTEALNRAKTQRIIGVFTLGMRPEYSIVRYGKKQAQLRWTEGLNQIADTCRGQIEPIILGAPIVPNSVPLPNGETANPELEQEFIRYTKGLAFELDAPYITFEQALGARFEDYAAADNKHTTALGYDRIARFLTRIIDHKLGIASDESIDRELARYAVTSSDLIYPKSDLELH